MDPKEYLSKLDALAKKQSVFQSKELSRIAKLESSISLEYDEDCDMLDICKELGATYDFCYKGASIAYERCSRAEKFLITRQHEQKIKEKRSWIATLINHFISLLVGILATIIALYIAKFLGLE